MADTDSTLIEVCNEIALALQKKLNTTSKFKPINYSTSIETIGSEANAAASDVKLGKKVYVGDDYVDGTFTGEDVTIQNNNVGGTQVELTPENGKYYQKVIIPAQPGLIAANIRKGVTIFGITGTLEEQIVLPKLATPVIELKAPDTATLIRFIIGSTDYLAEEGMTFGEWVESDYNTGNYRADDGSNEFYPYGIYRVLTHSIEFVDAVASDVIEANATYTVNIESTD